MNRDNIIQHLKNILQPLVCSYSDIGCFGDHSSCHGPHMSWFEMYCRSSYGIIAYTKATDDTTYLNIFKDTLLDAIVDKRYTTFKDYDQKVVELVPVATLLLLFKDKVWDTYTLEQKNIVVDYLNNINNVKLCDNNWVFFRIIVCSILQRLTERDFSKTINDGWRFVDACYQGEGWYRDGLEGMMDYYNAFAFHFYSLLYYYLFDDPERNNIIRERASLFAQQYSYFFDSQGRSIPYGRSLIYRYGILSFWSMMIVNELLDKKIEQRIISIIDKNLSWWACQNIYQENNIQCLGYTYPNSLMLEAYNSSGSVYWSLKFFLILLADKNSIIWSSKNRGLYEREFEIHRIANGNTIITSTPIGNAAFPNSFNGTHNQGQDVAKYMHFAYHSAVGFNITRGFHNFSHLSDDSSLIFKVYSEQYMRVGNIHYRLIDSWLQEFIWSPCVGINVITRIVPLGESYIRAHTIISNKQCECFETGYPIEKIKNDVIFIGDSMASVKNDHLCSYVNMYTGNGQPIIINNEPYSNIYYKQTVMPAIKYEIRKGIALLVDVTGLSNNNYTFNTKNDIININEQNAIIHVNIDGKNFDIPTKLNCRHMCLITSYHFQHWMTDKKNSIKNKVKQMIKR